jgi:hypothetical protein
VIPKIIHWCWFSGEEPPDKTKQCIETWAKILPDYEITPWGGEALDKIPLPPVIQKAREKQNWAIVADYARLYAVYEHGGIYMDSDAIAVKPFTGEMLSNKFFTAAEVFYGKVTGLQAAIFGAEKRHPFINGLMDWYREITAEDAQRVLSHEIIAPHVFAKVAEGYGWEKADKKQCLQEGMAIYPHQVLAGFYDQVTGETAAWHVCHGSWRKEPETKPTKEFSVLIGVPTSGYVKTETFESLYNLRIPPGMRHELFFAKAGYGVARNKNMIASKAVDGGYEYVFTVDDDMTFPPDIIERLLQLDADVASAWAMQLDGTANVCTYDATSNCYRCQRPEALGVAGGGVIQADAVGFACTLIKTSVYQRLSYPWHVYQEYENKTLLSEDLYFCDRLRSEAPGVQIKVGLSLRAGHIKTTIL